MTNQQRSLVTNLLTEHPTAILATADLKAVPAAAVVLFAADKQGKIIFGTHPSRKYKNLKANPESAIVFTTGMIALQMHGRAVELTGAEAATGQSTFMIKHPEADKHLIEGTVFFLFTPSWLRYMDMGAVPMTTFEGKV